MNVTICKRWSGVVGAMDAATGVALMVAPEMVAKVLGAELGGGAIWMRWIGAFVAGVGLSYGWAMRRGWGEPVWAVTATLRLAVAGFLTVAMAGGDLEPTWWGVAVTDGVVAAVQGLGLWKGWWRR